MFKKKTESKSLPHFLSFGILGAELLAFCAGCCFSLDGLPLFFPTTYKVFHIYNLQSIPLYVIKQSQNQNKLELMRLVK